MLMVLMINIFLGVKNLTDIILILTTNLLISSEYTKRLINLNNEYTWNMVRGDINRNLFDFKARDF